MRAIISDIHSNTEAFEVVLEDIRKHGIEDIICLGDIIGYGPNPKGCVDMSYGFRLTLMGNHEEAVLHEAQTRGFNPKATKAVRWTASQFDMLSEDKQGNARRWDFMGLMPRVYSQDSILCVHGSPVDPTRQYIYTTDVRNPNKMERIFEKIEHICFVGHTHVPGVWTEDMTYQSPEELDYMYEIDSRKTIVNVGSIGQPRDFDNRACYVIFDGSVVRFVKLEYDYQKTAEKIYAIDGLDDFLGDRLKEGR